MDCERGIEKRLGRIICTENRSKFSSLTTEKALRFKLSNASLSSVTDAPKVTPLDDLFIVVTLRSQDACALFRDSGSDARACHAGVSRDFLAEGVGLLESLSDESSDKLIDLGTTSHEALNNDSPVVITFDVLRTTVSARRSSDFHPTDATAVES